VPGEVGPCRLSGNKSHSDLNGGKSYQSPEKGKQKMNTGGSGSEGVGNVYKRGMSLGHKTAGTVTAHAGRPRGKSDCIIRWGLGALVRM